VLTGSQAAVAETQRSRGRDPLLVKMTAREQARAKKLLLVSGPILGVGLVVVRLAPTPPQPYDVILVLAGGATWMFFVLGLVVFLFSHQSSPAYRRKWTPTFLGLLFLSLGTCAFYVYAVAISRSSPVWSILLGTLAGITAATTVGLWRATQGPSRGKQAG
jgi:hypothetical protein